MRHLDDGQIAELIDSTGRRADGQTGLDLEAHLSECSACRERLEEARQIAARARSILATAVPVVPAGTAVPPFDEILHRAGWARRSGRGGGSLRWLAWAATVVVAGGLGWYARGEIREASRSAAPLAVNQPVVEADAIQPTDDERRANLADAAVTRNEQAAGLAGGAGAAGRVAEPTPPRLSVGAQREGFAPRDRPTEEAKAAAPPAPSAPAQLPMVPAEAARRAREAPSLRATPPTEAEQAPGAAVTTRVRADMLDRRIVITRAQAEQTMGGPLAALEGLPIDNYYVLPAEPGVIQTEQTLPRGGKLELEQWRAGTLRSPQQERGGFAQRALTSKDSTSVAAESLQVGDLWIVAWAPISADSLRMLLRKLRR